MAEEKKQKKSTKNETKETKETKLTANKKDVEENKILAVIAYFGILFLVPMLTKKDSPFAMFHAKQGLIITLVWVAYGILSVLPFIGWFVIAPFGWILALVLNILGIVYAAQGEMKEIPLVGQFGKKINI
jgi:uncharacterized membrane protein